MDSIPEVNKKYDVILVAGEGESSCKIYNQHKAFLKINGKCLVNYVLEALQQVEAVQDIYVVGSKDKLSQTLLESRVDLDSPKSIHILEQRANLYENIWHAFLTTLSIREDEVDPHNPAHADKAVLIVPCDSPLITPHEVEYFISQCDMENYDHILGLTSQENLEYFYPRGKAPGIKMTYLNLKETKCRINNLHLVKPLKIENREYIQKMYQYRYQRNIKNALLFGLSYMRKDRHADFRIFCGLQLALFFSVLNLNSLAGIFRSWTPKRKLEQCISKVLKTRFKGLQVPFPGAALDIDNDRDFEAMKLSFKDWREYLARLNRKYPLPYRREYTV